MSQRSQGRDGGDNPAMHSLKLMSEMDGSEPSVPLLDVHVAHSLPRKTILAPSATSSFLGRFLAVMRISGTLSWKIGFYLLLVLGVSGLSAYLGNKQAVWLGRRMDGCQLFFSCVCLVFTYFRA
jgi:hypothetical protein